MRTACFGSAPQADHAPRPQKAAGHSAQAYLDYVAWEREVKRPDTPLVKGIFERAVKDHPSDIEVWEAYLEFLVRRSTSSVIQILISLAHSTRSRRRSRTCARSPKRPFATCPHLSRSGRLTSASPCVTFFSSRAIPY